MAMSGAALKQLGRQMVAGMSNWTGQYPELFPVSNRDVRREQVLAGDRVSYEAVRDYNFTEDEMKAAGFVQEEYTRNWSKPGFV